MGTEETVETSPRCMESLTEGCCIDHVQAAQARSTYHVDIVINANGAWRENFQQSPEATADIQNASFGEDTTHEPLIWVLHWQDPLPPSGRA